MGEDDARGTPPRVAEVVTKAEIDEIEAQLAQLLAVPDDARFHANFRHGSAGYHEAAFAYQVAAWTQEISNAAVTLYHQRHDYNAAGLADRLAGAAMATRQLFHLATAQYDYLEFRQRDPVGAELYKATEAVPRNTFRGPKGRRWLSTVARDEVKINIKAAAEARVNKARGRKSNPGGGGGGGGGGSGGGGGDASLGGNCAPQSSADAAAEAAAAAVAAPTVAVFTNIAAAAAASSAAVGGLSSAPAARPAPPS
eukprot:contig_16586_g4036